MKKLLIIDPQVCFCDYKGSLFVKGADEDILRLSELIYYHPLIFSSIDISLDMHQLDDIAHPLFWVDKDGNHPAPFTQITFEDAVENKIWMTAKEEDSLLASRYLKFLKDSGQFTHTIWPVHAIAGTESCNITEPLLRALNVWQQETKKTYHTHTKGIERGTEHYGIFQAEGPNSQFNHYLCNKIFSNGDEIFVSGQAKSHCVAKSLKQVLDTYPQFVPQITLLTDTTSNVEEFKHIADSIYQELERFGMKNMTTKELIKSVK